MANILWMDNDKTYLMPFVMRLQLSGHKVVQAFTVDTAEQYLRHPEEQLGHNMSWDLILIDIMMRIKHGDPVNSAYSADATAKGKRAGFVFYELNKEEINKQKAIPAFLTMRQDDEPRQEVQALGLSPDNLMRKMAVADSRDFEQWIERLLEKR